MKRIMLILLTVVCSPVLHAQQKSYLYELDLRNNTADSFHVKLIPPSNIKGEKLFSLPKIIPGTYSISDYGKFVGEFKAYANKGNLLPVSQIDSNTWKIDYAGRIDSITYSVDDIFDASKKHGIYPMAASNIEADKNTLIHPSAIFGFFRGHGQMPFEVNIHKPETFYASTNLNAVTKNAQWDLFKVNNVDQLYDAPILYTVPDTAILRVANTDILVSVYSASKKVHAADIASWMKSLLEATAAYLGGNLPTDRYAFLFYFKGAEKHSFPRNSFGALEHNQSSVYYLPDGEPRNLKNFIIDIASHEFFHIITPLTLASKEVRQFNYHEAVLSKHLWLYEGVTEYISHHVQVKQQLNTAQEFLNKLSQKINISQQAYNDSLSFLKLSKESAGKYAAQYGNVYQKGALIAACIDLVLLDYSGGKMSLKDLVMTLGKKYGKDDYFDDESLIDEIVKMTGPAVASFFNNYMIADQPIPYQQFLSLAGIDLIPEKEQLVYSIGIANPQVSPEKKVVIGSNGRINDFGKKLGYEIGDELLEMNGKAIMPDTYQQTIQSIGSQIKAGDIFTVKVKRKSKSSDTIEEISLSVPFEFTKQIIRNSLELNSSPTERQTVVRNQWLQ